MVPRHITLIRHAKSDWADPTLKDFERPLNGRGLRAARMMALRAKNLGWKPDLLLCSGAVRTRETALHFLEAFQLPDALLQMVPDLYEARPETLLQAIRNLSDDHVDVLLFAHNPGLEMLASDLADTSLAFPTCAMARFACASPSWRTCQTAQFRLLHHDFPHNPSLAD